MPDDEIPALWLLQILNFLWATIVVIVLGFSIFAFPFLAMTLVAAPEIVGVMFFVSYAVVGLSVVFSIKCYKNPRWRTFALSVFMPLIYFAFCWFYLWATGQL